MFSTDTYLPQNGLPIYVQIPRGEWHDGVFYIRTNPHTDLGGTSVYDHESVNDVSLACAPPNGSPAVPPHGPHSQVRVSPAVPWILHIAPDPPPTLVPGTTPSTRQSCRADFISNHCLCLSSFDHTRL